MRAETLLLFGLVAILAVLVGAPTATSDAASPVATQHSAGGFTLVAAVIAVVVGGRYRTLVR